jgi:hypothetical protein
MATTPATDGRRSILFEYAIIWQPKERFDANGNDTTPPAEVLVQPTRILVRNEAEARIRASREVPEAYLGKLDEVEIAVRPF